MTRETMKHTSASFAAYQEMQDLLGSGKSGQVEGRRLVYPADPDQGIELKAGDRHDRIHWTGATRMILKGPWNWNSAGSVMRHDILTNVRLMDCRKSGKGGTLWGLNAYEVKDLKQFDCLTDRMGVYPEPTDGARTEGHGDYLHFIGGAEARWYRCRFEHLMGNGIQGVRRVGESAIEPVPDYGSAQKLSIIEGCDFINTAQGQERGSFPISWFAPGSGLEVTDTLVQYPKEGGAPKGGLLVGDPQSYIKRGETEQRTGVVRVSKLVIQDAMATYTATHAGVQLQGVDRFESDGVLAIGPQPRKFVFDEDCGNINVMLYGKWSVVKRTLKVPGGVPKDVGFNYLQVKSIDGRGRFAR